MIVIDITGKEQMQSGSAEQVDADVDMKPRNLREAAKAMPRIPKISERLPRDPRLQKPVGELTVLNLSFCLFSF